MRDTRRISSFPGCRWKSFGAPVITTRCARCAIPRPCSDLAIGKASTRSILPWTGVSSGESEAAEFLAAFPLNALTGAPPMVHGVSDPAYPSIVWKDGSRLFRIAAKPPSADIERQDD